MFPLEEDGRRTNFSLHFKNDGISGKMAPLIIVGPDDKTICQVFISGGIGYIQMIRICLFLKQSQADSVEAYFFLNRSTLPAVSTIFCFPVKKG